MRKEIQTANKMEVLFHLRLKHINSWKKKKTFSLRDSFAETNSESIKIKAIIGV